MMLGSHKSLLNGPCPICGAKNWKVGKLVDSGGGIRYPWYCGGCGARSQVFAKKAVALAELAPLLADLRTHRCEVCGALGAQLHHWAPQAVFGAEAEDWPKGYLCQMHHSRWHALMSKAVKS